MENKTTEYKKKLQRQRRRIERRFKKKNKSPKRIDLRKSENTYLNVKFVCHLCGRLCSIKEMMIYPNKVMELIPEFPRPYDGSCWYCFEYELDRRTQEKILVEKIEQDKETYKQNCVIKRHGGKSSGPPAYHWMRWISSIYNMNNGSMLYHRLLKQKLRDLISRIKLLGYDD